MILLMVEWSFANTRNNQSPTTFPWPQLMPPRQRLRSSAEKSACPGQPCPRWDSLQSAGTPKIILSRFGNEIPTQNECPKGGRSFVFILIDEINHKLPKQNYEHRNTK